MGGGVLFSLSWGCVMKKAQVLALWSGLPADQKVKPEVISYEHTGSTYACDGIRVTGSREFIESVMSKLKGYLAFENSRTRLQVNFQESKDKDTGAPLDSFNFYVQVRERGHQAQMMGAFLNRLGR